MAIVSIEIKITYTIVTQREKSIYMKKKKKKRASERKIFHRFCFGLYCVHCFFFLGVVHTVYAHVHTHTYLNAHLNGRRR